jgi:hypothetical protein
MKINEAKFHDHMFITHDPNVLDLDLYNEHEFLRQHHQRVVDKHEQTLQTYATASRGFNEYMLTKKQDYRRKHGSALAARMDQRRKDVHKAFKDAPFLGVALHVYSGLNVPHGSELLKLQPGKVVTSKTVLSTSINPRIAKTFMKSGQMRKNGGTEQALLHLELPEETKGIYMHDVSPHPSEYEYALPPKTKFQITGMHSILLPHGTGGIEGAQQRTLISGKILNK